MATVINDQRRFIEVLTGNRSAFLAAPMRMDCLLLPYEYGFV